MRPPKFPVFLIFLAVGLVQARPMSLEAPLDQDEQVWEAFVAVGDFDMPYVLHLTKKADGSCTASLDSPAQGLMGIEVASVLFDQKKLAFEVKELGVKYEGDLDAIGIKAVGEWVEYGVKSPATFKKKSDAAIAAAKPVGKEEVWEAKVNLGGIDRTVVLKVWKTANGSTVATVSQPDLSLIVLTVDSLILDKSKLSFDLRQISGKARYEGKFNPERTEVAGRWTEKRSAMPITFKKKTEAEIAALEPDGKPVLWEGKISWPSGVSTRLVLHIQRTVGGTHRATIDLPDDDGVKGLWVKSISIDRTILKFDLGRDYGARFKGTVNAKGTEADGVWTQEGMADIKLKLKVIRNK